MLTQFWMFRSYACGTLLDKSQTLENCMPHNILKVNVDQMSHHEQMDKNKVCHLADIYLMLSTFLILILRNMQPLIPIENVGVCKIYK